MRNPSTISLPRSALPALALIVLTLAGCAANRSRFPSLERRPAERLYGILQPVAAPAPVAVNAAPANDAGIAARLMALRGQAREAQRAFAEQQAVAARLASAARGAVPGSEAWSVAQVALGGLDSARSKAMIAMADLDRMLIDASLAEAEGNTADLALVKAAHSDVQGIVSEEDKAIAAIRNTIAG